jgi:hypothetical protein
VLQHPARIWLCLALLLGGCDRAKGASPQAERPAAAPSVDASGPDPYAEFPLYGLIGGTVVTVRKSADPTAVPLGWLRRGETVRLKPSQDKTAHLQQRLAPAASARLRLRRRGHRGHARAAQGGGRRAR